VRFEERLVLRAWNAASPSMKALFPGIRFWLIRFSAFGN